VAAVGEAPHRRFPVRVAEDVGALRRAVSELASRSGEVAAGEAALVATELATNLVRHTTSGGYILYRAFPDGIELVAVDRGPGMVRSEIAHPGAPDQRSSSAPPAPVSRSGGLGVGLAGVKRTASTFDVYSTRPEGSVVLARLGASAAGRDWCQWGVVNVPFGGEGESGDGCVVSANGSLATLVVDGLGHGSDAAAAAWAAIDAFGEEKQLDLVGFVGAAHQAMQETRGGVLAVCAIEPDTDDLSFVGVGNITARFIGTKHRTFMGRNGSIGTHAAVPSARPEHHRWEPGATLIMASDGLRSAWGLEPYPGLLWHDPTVIAAVLERDFGRGTDDALVLVVRDIRKEPR
jgi:anti-sigma regulatory factor (Ser/Thr protein kinase)